MLLDSHLVERFHALHRQRLSGSLVAEGAGFHLEICLIEGEPAAVDIGVDLEDAFAEACRTYHKIDDAGHAELRAAMAGGAKARDYLITRQLISDAEADQVAQAVVEDRISLSFRGPCTRIDFTPGTGPDQFAIGRTAVKMRIAVEALIRTCDQQASEIQSVQRDIGGWDSVFALSEEEHVSGQLSEYEKMVLNFIDGKSTVEQIAELCRDSSFNLARVLRSLVAKRIIHRVERSGLRQAVNIPAEASAAAGAATASSIRQVDITPYHAPRKQDRGRGVVLAGLIALLAISLGVAFLVVQYNRTQDRLRRDEAEVMQYLGARSWAEARSTVSRLRGEAGSDIGAVRLVDGLSQRVEAALVAETAAINDLIANEEFVAARSRIAALPEEGGLAAKLRLAMDDVRESNLEIAKEIRSRLAVGDVAGALAAVESAAPRRRPAGEAELALWRTATLAEVRDASRPLPARLSALARMRQALPDAATEAVLNALEGDLQGQVRAAVSRLDELERLAKAGAHREVAAELEKFGPSKSGDMSGAEVSARLERVAETAKRTAAALDGVEKQALEALATGQDADVLDARRAALAAMVKTFPQASGRERLERILGALAASSSSAARTLDARAEESLAIAQQVPAGETGLAEAMRRRASALKAVESAAATALEDARRMGRNGDWDGAVSALDHIVKRREWSQASVRDQAEQELDLARSRAARRQQLRGDLAEALRRGDMATCERIAREIGLAYLPLVVSSSPDGSEVADGDGKVLGTTPLVLDITADQRVDLHLTVRHPGFDPVTVPGASADGGWKLVVALPRTPVARIELGHPLTSRPAVVDGQLWLADRGRVVMFASPGAAPAIQQIEALSEPVFAPVATVGRSRLLATRERVALQVGGTTPTRVALPVGTDLAPLHFVSQVVVDRELTVIAGRDGRLYAIDAAGRSIWQGEAGAAFSGMLLVGEEILAVRADGRLDAVRIEDGVVARSESAGGQILAAWAEPGIQRGMTADRVWSWSGGAVKTEQLPEPCIAGGPGVVVTALGKVLVRGSDRWTESVRLDPRPQPGRIGGALCWAGHGVVANGSVLQVCGPTGFRLEAGAEILPPVLWGDVLVVATIEGRVWMYR